MNKYDKYLFNIYHKGVSKILAQEKRILQMSMF